MLETSLASLLSLDRSSFHKYGNALLMYLTLQESLKVVSNAFSGAPIFDLSSFVMTILPICVLKKKVLWALQPPLTCTECRHLEHGDPKFTNKFSSLLFFNPLYAKFRIVDCQLNSLLVAFHSGVLPQEILGNVLKCV